MLRIVAFVSLFLSVLCTLQDIRDGQEGHNTLEAIRAEGYPAEAHHVTTSDGYILELHRIPFGKKSRGGKTRPVVFLMHGILGASNSFTYLGAKSAIAYNLADAGYDVWMGNARGTRNSRRHVSLNPDRNKLRFFDFSFEEIGLDDLPAMIDYVLDRTGRQKLHYIGHSQGGTVFFILNSMKTEYNRKIESAHLLASVGYQTDFPNTQLRLLAVNTDSLYGVLRASGNVELFPPGSDGIFGRSGSKGIIDSVLNFNVSSELIGGAAVKQIAHYGQNIRDRRFRRWDYGPMQNLIRYGSIRAPAYDITKIDIDITLHYSLNDVLLSESDTLLMARDIPNAKVRKIARESFGHLDYVTSNDVKELVTDYVIEALGRY